MAALISVLVTVVLSLLVTRIATEAMVLTGLSHEAAQFQASSAFTGAGFTTQESEQVASHPVRRRIIMWLMLLGNAGVVTVVSSLVLTFISSPSSQQTLIRIVFLGLGMLGLWAIATDLRFNRTLTHIVQWALQHWTDLDVRDYASLLRLTDEYMVSELLVEEGMWLAHKTISELSLQDEGIVVLGIQRAQGLYIGAPQTKTQIVPGDLIILYGRDRTLSNLHERLAGLAGELSHQQAITRQQAVINRETETDATLTH